MGNEHSEQYGVQVKDKPIQITNFWAHHTGTFPSSSNPTNLSIFIGDLFVSEALWSEDSPLKKNSKNLMIYRHPCILKYISSWQKMSKFYLAVEEVSPLSQVLSKLTILEICIGLHSILKALCFLHQQATVSHNNVCVSSLYVNKDCSWKLGGMEYACRYKELSSEYLAKTQSSRYSKARDSNEIKYVNSCKGREDFVDVYGFATLAVELLNSKVDDTIPALDSFRDLCKTIIQTSNIADRPNLNTIMDHDFFKNKFLKIYSFLVELPLKTDLEKSEFFLNLSDELRSFDEEIVASHLGGLLLSRMVFLDKTAQNHFLPCFLLVRSVEECQGLFSKSIFKKYIAPKIIKIISVRDLQIRLLLLTYFSNFMDSFSEDELASSILPELLVGIKDTNDELVAATLRVLANLVPILGADVVIGGQRARLFNDGRPVAQSSTRRLSRVTKTIETQQVEVQTDENQSVSNSIVSTHIALQERPRPDGEEGDTSTEEIETYDDEDLGNWEDWNNENEETATRDVLNEQVDVTEPSKTYSSVPKKLIDITKLDIKNQDGLAGIDEEVDFFQDMEPVIETKGKFIINEITKEYSSKLTLTADDGNEDGWGNDDWN